MENLLAYMSTTSGLYIGFALLLAIGVLATDSKGWVKGLFVVAMTVLAFFIYAIGENKKQDNERQVAEAAEMAWKEPIINNCENAVRAISDAQTLKLGGMFGGRSFDVVKTDRGYLYRVQASDATTANKTATMLCYTDMNGQVVRVVPQNSY